MKVVILLALFACVALADEAFYNECVTTKQGFDAWKADGERIVTFGLSWCKKAWRSKFTFIHYIKNSKSANGITYHFLNCNKYAEGTCKGLFDNFLDYVGPEHKLLEYRAPRTFYINRKGKNIKVHPITKSGRLHSTHRKDQPFFDGWLARCRK